MDSAGMVKAFESSIYNLPLAAVVLFRGAEKREKLEQHEEQFCF